MSHDPTPRIPGPPDATPRQRFTELAHRPDEELDVALGAALIAAEEYGTLRPDALLGELDRLAEPLNARLGAEGEPEVRLRALTSYLHDELGFSGNTDDYYDPKNSFLSDVLERRVGIPITLATVYIEVGRRVGVRLAGVAFPGHFLLRFEGNAVCFLDPFAPSHLMSIDDTRALFMQLGGEAGEFDERYLAPASPRTILVRMLRNLKLIYLKTDELEKAAAIIDRILLLCPDDLREYRDRGIAYMKLEAYLLALPDLLRYLEGSPHAPDRAAITAAVDYLHEQVAGLN
jgi:regulator of sirC expression with transglutaminase-like and TPR domain